MADFWRRALIFPSLLLFAAMLVWVFAGMVPAFLFLGVALLLRWAFHLRQIARLEYWLQDPEARPIPDGAGLWEDVFAKLNKLMRMHREEREQNRSTLRHMEQATSALPEGVVILGDADRIEWCNLLACKHFGLDVVRDVGQQITYLARKPEFVQYLAARDFGEPLVLRDMRGDSPLILSVKLITYSANKKLLISSDITRFERIETMRRDFVANVSHELRTPLTVVNGFVETMSDMPKLENDMARRALHLMGDQTRRMQHLVDDLLTLSKLDDALNVLQEGNVDMPLLLGTLYEEGCALSAGRHDLRLEMESDASLQGSKDELRSALGNLVSNAIRYTPEGGKIMLRWQERAGGLVFSVEDSGLGIAPQHIPRLTERFYRVDNSRSRETGGTGLGLAIVKHVVMRHQAQLDIVSEEGKGSTFSIVFPERRKLPAPAEAASRDGSAAA